VFTPRLHAAYNARMSATRHLDGSEPCWRPPAQFIRTDSITIRWSYDENGQRPLDRTGMDVEIVLRQAFPDTATLLLRMKNVTAEGLGLSWDILEDLRVFDIQSWQWDHKRFLVQGRLDDYESYEGFEFYCSELEICESAP
jgi:hypothetical protein